MSIAIDDGGVANAAEGNGAGSETHHHKSQLQPAAGSGRSQSACDL